MVLVSRSPLPLGFRQKEDHYRFSSPGWVPGIMQGEAWNRSLEFTRVPNL
jgi:hypothetical protein